MRILKFPMITIEVNPPTTYRFPPAKICIYCGAQGTEIGDEHIIPLGLNGTVILPKASCRTCATITGAFEGICQRTILGNYRIKRNFMTRRKKGRPKTILVTGRTHDGQIKTISVAVSDYPTVLHLCKFEKARTLLGLPDFYYNGIQCADWLQCSPAVPDFTVEHNLATFELGKFQPFPFARLLAKIAHSFCVADLGLGSFKPKVLDLILGRTDDMSIFVGGSLGPAPAPDKCLHKLNMEITNINNRNYIVVHIRLFADHGAPAYHVVVGELE